MSGHLLALAVGPVQEFIAAARRTRDLWFGSFILSEISKAAAKAVEDGGGKLIFPAPSTSADLGCGSPLTVANVILAELDETDPQSLAGRAKSAARQRWRSFADEVLNSRGVEIDSGIWTDQVDDVIEFYAAWHPVSPDTYRSDRAAVMRLLSARKKCRNFLPAKGRAGVPKSSLDGLRESVLRRADGPMGTPHRRLRLRTGEELDVVGVVKRAWAPGGAPVRYPSVARVAADPWLRRVPQDELSALKDACRNLGTDVIHEIDVSKDRGHPQYAHFPFEGTAAYRSRHHELREEAGISESDFRPLVSAFGELTKRYGEPNPYLALLVADGDRIGEALAELSSPDEHRIFSQALAGFAVGARTVVAEHSGILVYAGGDDVLAFVPVDRCLACARALHDRFGDALKSSSTYSASITLSVGIAIAHFIEPLEDLLGYARAAERDAKGARGERDGLAIHVLKRGGGPFSVPSKWVDRPDELLAKLAGWIAAESISGRLAYELREIAGIYDSWPAEFVGDAIRRDVLSIMEGKQPTGSSRRCDISDMVRTRVKDADSLRRLADELLIAKALRPPSASARVEEAAA